jgi:hypothetical protein
MRVYNGYQNAVARFDGHITIADKSADYIIPRGFGINNRVVVRFIYPEKRGIGPNWDGFFQTIGSRFSGSFFGVKEPLPGRICPGSGRLRASFSGYENH